MACALFQKEDFPNLSKIRRLRTLHKNGGVGYAIPDAAAGLPGGPLISRFGTIEHSTFDGAPEAARAHLSTAPHTSARRPMRVDPMIALRYQ